METIQCGDCQTTLNAKAFFCTKCGVQVRIPKRTRFGKICKSSFILFNIFMAFQILRACGAVSNGIDSSNSIASTLGILTGGGFASIIYWLMWGVGNIILGFLTLSTRPSIVNLTEEKESSPNIFHPKSSNPYNFRIDQNERSTRANARKNNEQ